MIDSIAGFFDRVWDGYLAITPQAERVHRLLSGRGEKMVHDHVAFRTYDLAPISLARLAAPFLEKGFAETGRYRFFEKKLSALSFSHPSGRYPRVFLSELETAKLSGAAAGLVQTLVGQMDEDLEPDALLLGQGGWPSPSLEVYRSLAEESEYAAWVSAFGIRANHFTVSLNGLEGFESMAALNSFLEEEGFVLNATGGKIKGSPGVLLEQSSTMADRIPWSFAEGCVETIPSCYVEFARRYPDEQGVLYEGFVTESADRIFESTHK